MNFKKALGTIDLVLTFIIFGITCMHNSFRIMTVLPRTSLAVCRVMKVEDLVNLNLGVTASGP